MARLLAPLAWVPFCRADASGAAGQCGRGSGITRSGVRRSVGRQRSGIGVSDDAGGSGSHGRAEQARLRPARGAIGSERRAVPGALSACTMILVFLRPPPASWPQKRDKTDAGGQGTHPIRKILICRRRIDPPSTRHTKRRRPQVTGRSAASSAGDRGEREPAPGRDRRDEYGWPGPTTPTPIGKSSRRRAFASAPPGEPRGDDAGRAAACSQACLPRSSARCPALVVPRPRRPLLPDSEPMPGSSATCARSHTAPLRDRARTRRACTWLRRIGRE
jgi:hypothetical protein